jgi:hypothetical protein
MGIDSCGNTSDNRDMATWGRLNSGQTYHVIAVDIDRAIAHMRFSGYESMLFQYVREQCWGVVTRTKKRGEPWPGAKPCVLNVSALALEWDVPRQRLQAAKQSLVKRAVLTHDNSSVTINKNVDEWVGLSEAGKRYSHKAKSIICTENRAGVARKTVQGGERKTVQGVNGKPDKIERKTVQAPHYVERTRDSEERVNTEKTVRETACAKRLQDRDIKDIAQDQTIPLSDRASIIMRQWDAGEPDSAVSGMLGQWIAGYSERAVLAAAFTAATKNRPVPYFIGMCKNGLADPSQVTPSEAAAADPDSPEEKKRRQLAKAIEIFKQLEAARK